MQKFILNMNEQPNGDYEVHNKSTGCAWMPLPENQIDLGYHFNCHDAVAEAKRRYQYVRINGCRYCCWECHTS